MAASIEDVARLAGVSIATVSRALRGLPDVAESTRDRVLEAASSLDYVASPFAARLASGRTSTLGLVVPFVNRWYFGEVINAAESALRQAGFDLLLYNLGDEDGRTRFFERMPIRKRVDAVLVASLVLRDDEIAALETLDCPLGLLGMEHEKFLSTRIDDATAARQAVDHLIALGHRRLAIIGGDPDDPMRITPPMHRREAFRSALRAAGIESDPSLEQLGYFTIDGGREACDRILAAGPPPTAIFAESDEMAFGAMRSLRHAGLRVPDDVVLMGFDDHAMSAVLDLSTVRQPVAEQAVEMVGRLLTALDENAEPVPADVVLPTELIIRGSTDPSRSVYRS